MSSWNSNVWGPHPKHAVVPAIAVLAVVAWVAAKNPGPLQASTGGTPVTVMKPVEGATVALPRAEMPVEVRYGVPSQKNLHLWPEILHAR